MIAVKPEQLLYSETHEWVRMDKSGNDKIATIGISAFAVQQLTDLVYMELPEVGRKLEAGDEFGVVESVKAVSPLVQPGIRRSCRRERWPSGSARNAE